MWLKRTKIIEVGCDLTIVIIWNYVLANFEYCQKFGYKIFIAKTLSTETELTKFFHVKRVVRPQFRTILPGATLETSLG